MVLFEVRSSSASDLFLSFSISIVYDVLTGEIQLTLRASNNAYESREKCVRDISWHPYENYIISTSVRIFELLVFFVVIN